MLQPEDLASGSQAPCQVGRGYTPLTLLQPCAPPPSTLGWQTAKAKHAFLRSSGFTKAVGGLKTKAINGSVTSRVNCTGWFCVSTRHRLDLSSEKGASDEEMPP